MQGFRLTSKLCILVHNHNGHLLWLWRLTISDLQKSSPKPQKHYFKMFFPQNYLFCILLDLFRTIPDPSGRNPESVKLTPPKQGGSNYEFSSPFERLSTRYNGVSTPLGGSIAGFLAGGFLLKSSRIFASNTAPEAPFSKMLKILPNRCIQKALRFYFIDISDRLIFVSGR